MKLSAIDIRQQRFEKSWRGYSTVQVQRFLLLVAEQTAALTQALQQAQATVVEHERALATLQAREDSLKAATLLAQRSAAAVRQAATDKASACVEAAKGQAAAVVEAAHQEARSIVAGCAEVALQRTQFIDELRGLVHTHARLLDVQEETKMGAQVDRYQSEAPVAPLAACAPPTADEAAPQ